MYYYEVAPTAIVRTGHDSFTYSSDMEVAIGTIVEIEISNRTMVGVVISKHAKPEYTVKPIKRTVEQTPLPVSLIDTLQWMSTYYHTPLATVLQTALPRGLTTKRRAFENTRPAPVRSRTNIVFTASQKTALDTINSMPLGTALLHGVTGSGKTLVYIEAAKNVLKAGQSVIVLVPEIALTSQLVADFSSHFKDVLLTHSQQTERERHAIWLEALTSSSPRIAIGPRSALFLPLSSIGLIVIDECHEPSYKQEQSPRYSALRVASVLASNHNQSKVVLGSATPLVADYYLAKQARRPIIIMPVPARHDTAKPSIHLVDMKKRASFSRHRFLSDALLTHISATLVRHEQVLLFHNRRGSAPTTLCESCGWQAGCARCFVPLTLHADTHQLTCHICGSHSRVPTSCPECGATDIVHRGIGTKLLEQEITKLFPHANVARFDSDTDSSSTLDRRYTEVHDGTIDIIIGTQVIAKGLDLPHLRTVGVIQADAGLSLPDYSSAERTFQLLAQVIGRVGRSSHKTQVIVQSFQPNHPSVHDGINQDYASFYQRTIALRKHTNFPPFTYLLKCTCTYKTESVAIKNSRALVQTFKETLPGVEVLGPTPAFYERVRDTYRWQIVLKSTNRQSLLRAVDSLPSKHWQYELDPISLL